MIYEDAVTLATGFGEKSDSVDKHIQVLPSVYEPSLITGFPSAYSAPHVSGGKQVLRSQMNGLGYYATASDARRQSGGINTYNPKLVEETGGYKIGAMLDWWDNEKGMLSQVISLVNDNTHDFRETGPDGVYWRSCRPSEYWLPDHKMDNRQIIASFDSLALKDVYSFVSDEMTMPFDGYINCFTEVKVQVPTAKVPYCTYAGDRCGVTNNVVKNSTQQTGNGVVDPEGDLAVCETVELAAFSAFADCYHKLYLCIGNPPDDAALNVSTTDPVMGTRNCAVFLVSSSGLEGSAAQVMIPARAGDKLRLIGMQTYTKTHTVSYDKLDITRQVGWMWGQYVDDQGMRLTGEKETSAGTFNLTCVLEAYPPKGED